MGRSPHKSTIKVEARLIKLKLLDDAVSYIKIHDLEFCTLLVNLWIELNWYYKLNLQNNDLIDFIIDVIGKIYTKQTKIEVLSDGDITKLKESINYLFNNKIVSQISLGQKLIGCVKSIPHYVGEILSASK